MIKKYVYIGLVVFLCCAQPVGALTLDEVQIAITENNALWTANFSGNHTFANLTNDGLLVGYPEIESIWWDGVDRPDQYDLRDYNLVTGVKNQVYCGSCWAFAACGALESAILKAWGVFVDLSEQQLVDTCCPSNICGDCGGGSSFSALKYINETGIDLEQNYPYTMRTEICKLSPDWQDRAWTFNKYYLVSKYNIAEATQQGIMLYGAPFIYIDTKEDFVYYAGGIYEPLIGGGVNHVVILVGWNWTGNTATSYWIIKNSWGRYWGENGFGKIAWDTVFENQNTIAFVDEPHLVQRPSPPINPLIYDYNINGVIDYCEAEQAYLDYFHGNSSCELVTSVLMLYEQPPCDRYDIDHNGNISYSEACIAVDDYYAGCISATDDFDCLLDIIQCYAE